MTDTFEVDGVTFSCAMALARSRSAQHFHLDKPVELARAYLDLTKRLVDTNLVEIGIRQGGSAALATLAGRPRRMVAIDIAKPVPALQEFIDQRGLHDRLRPHFGVDQADEEAVARIVDDAFGGEPIDVVIDDGSHLIDATRASFEVLFPRLRPGGRYLIEDWDWELRYVAEFERLLDDDPVAAAGLASRIVDDPMWSRLSATAQRRATDRRVRDTLLSVEEPPQPYQPLALLAMELTTALAVTPGLVASVAVDRWWITVERGPDTVAAPIDLAAITSLAGDLTYRPAGTWQ
ncbi:MAG: class I SAM-dependent methyltransferase [Acidimicrobiia bacterium]|nr:class I SAM-dependent methyltransferase [Acidimicrobiia bacterium]